MASGATSPTLSVVGSPSEASICPGEDNPVGAGPGVPVGLGVSEAGAGGMTGTDAAWVGVSPERITPK